MPEVGSLTIEDAQLIYRNFAGREGLFNAEGDRNFSVLLDEDTANRMLEDGWNVRELKPRDGEERGAPILQVSVSFKRKPPEIYLVSRNRRTKLTEDMVELLDAIDYSLVDLIVNPYPWSVGGKSGIKAYLKKMFVTVREDDLDRKYENVGFNDEGDSD